MNKPTIVILAGGEGKRFAPLKTNKTLIPFQGKPLLQHILEMVETAGFSEVLIATNPENDDWLQTYTNANLSIRTKLQPNPLGMADALLHLETEIGKSSILVMNAVDLVEPSLLEEILEKSADVDGIVVGKTVLDHVTAGYLKVEGDTVTEIVEKPLKGEEPSNLINLVFHYFKYPETFIQTLKEIPEGSDDRYEQALSKMLKTTSFSFISYDGYWQKLKYCHHILDMMELMLRSTKPFVHKTAEVSPHAVITGDVYIEEGAKIFEGASIVGPAYIGKNVVVGQQTLIRESMIEQNSVIGFGTEVARSYIGPGCNLHHNFIGDSVLESNINPSYGTCTTNWKLLKNTPVSIKLPDEVIETNKMKLGAIIADSVFFGVNCSLLPGVTIGEGAKIYPGTIVHSAVKAHTTIKTYQEQKVVEETS